LASASATGAAMAAVARSATNVMERCIVTVVEVDCLDVEVVFDVAKDVTSAVRYEVELLGHLTLFVSRLAPPVLSLSVLDVLIDLAKRHKRKWLHWKARIRLWQMTHECGRSSWSVSRIAMLWWCHDGAGSCTATPRHESGRPR